MNKVLLYGVIFLLTGIFCLVITSETSSGLISCYEYAKEQVAFDSLRNSPQIPQKVDICTSNAVKIEGYKLCTKKYTEVNMPATANVLEVSFQEYRVLLASLISKAMRPTLKEPAYFIKTHNELCAPMAEIQE